MRMRRTRSRPTTGSGDALPPVRGAVAPTDEGPMRRELLRQIAHLETQLSRFTYDNAPFEPMPPVRRRGPAVLETATLEEIRDELLAVRAELHERVVRRAGERLDDDLSAPPRSTGRRLFGRRRRTGS